jgi:hypothetical protein
MNLGNFQRLGVLAIAMSLAGAASSQTVSMWMNKQGSATSAMPGTIFVIPGEVINLSVYMRTTGMANTLFNISSMFGYDSTTTVGGSAVAGGSGLTASNPTWVGAFGGPTTLTGGGLGAGTRPFGKWSSVFTTGTFTTADNTDIKLYDIAVTVSGSLVMGDTRTLTLHNGGGDLWSSFVFRDGMVSQDNVATSNVSIQVVPEPATMAVLGLGLLAFRRRKNK